jgi:positive regulator of sigma E activity
MSSVVESQKISLVLALIVYLVGVLLIQKYQPQLGTKKKFAEIALLVILTLIILVGAAVSGKL